MNYGGCGRLPRKIGGTGGALVKMLILTGQRRFETSTMRWRDLSGIENGSPLWSIPGESRETTASISAPRARGRRHHQGQPVLQVKTEEQTNSEFTFTTNGVLPFAALSRRKMPSGLGLFRGSRMVSRRWRCVLLLIGERFKVADRECIPVERIAFPIRLWRLGARSRCIP